MKKHVGAALVALAFSGSTQAAGSIWYVGLDVGPSSHSGWKTNANELRSALAASGPFTQMSTSINDKSTGYILSIGRRAGNFALEVLFADFWEFSAKYVNSTTLNATMDAAYNAYGIAIPGFISLSENWELSGKIGIGRLEEKVEHKETTNSPQVSLSDSDSASSLILGLGLSYKGSQNFAVSLNYNRFTFSRESGNYESISLASLGARFSF